MIEILAKPLSQELHANSRAELAAVIEEMLANYMTPTMLSHSKESIHLFAQKIVECSPMHVSSPESKL